MTTIEQMEPESGIDDLAYRFWSIHPNDIPDPVGMPEGYKGGARAWFYATEIRRKLSALHAQLTAAEEARDDAEGALSMCHQGAEHLHAMHQQERTRAEQAEAEAEKWKAIATNASHGITSWQEKL